MLLTERDDKKIIEKSGIVSIFKEPFFFFFLFYVVVWYTQLAERWASWTRGIRIEAVVSAVLLLVVISDSSKKQQHEKSGIAPYVGLYFVVLLIQVLNSWDSERSWFFFTERVLKYSAMGLFISIFVKNVNHLRLFIFVWLLSCFKIVQEGVYGGVTGSLVWYNQGIPRLHGSTELYGHPNSLSQLALGTLPFIYFLFPVVKKKWLKFSLLLLLACAVYCIIFTGSRTGYLGVILMMLLIFCRSPAKDKFRLALVLLLILPLTIKYIPADYKGRFMSTFIGHEKEGHSKEGRKKMYSEGWDIFIKHPFGVGVGNYVIANEKYNHYRQEVHCLYLEALTHIGIQGFIVFFVLIGQIFIIIYRVLRQLSQLLEICKKKVVAVDLMEDLQFVCAVANSVIVYLMIRLLVDILGMDLYGICWWFVIGLTSSLFYITCSLQQKIDSAEDNSVVGTVFE